MSLSDDKSKPLTGRVIMGINTKGPQESTLQDIEGKKRPVWDEATSAEYMDRVRKRARAHAREIVDKAMKEAAELKQNAYQEGYQQGLQAAGEELAQREAEFGAQLAELLESIRSQGARVWKTQRQDFVTLLRLCVEKTTATMLDTDREQVLANLLQESMEAIDSRRKLIIWTSEEDQKLLEALVNRVKDDYPQLGQWQVKASGKLAPGGLVMESENGMVDNALDSRWEEVRKVFVHLDSAEADQEQQAPGARQEPPEASGENNPDQDGQTPA
jgi:flagellar assembly protein FliH